MTTLSETLPGIREAIPGLYVRVLTDIADDDLIPVPAGAVGIINFQGKRRDTTAADVDAVRAALTAAGFAEVDSWVATEGASWMSDGVQSVSIRVRRAGE